MASILKRFSFTRTAQTVDLTKGSIVRGLIAFAIPIFLGQLLQQLYNMADAWVVGNFASNDAFAAVSLSGNISFLIVGFFNGIGIGGSVIISRHYGAKDTVMVQKAIHTNFLFGLVASVVSTVLSLLLVHPLLGWMQVPESVVPEATAYFSIYFAGVSTIIMYNICMAIMRSLGDSIHPLYYLMLSSVVNVLLDLLFVAIFKWSVAGAAIATVLAQGLSVVLCIIRMLRDHSETRLDLKKLRFDPEVLRDVLRQGLPTGIQNCVISIGNLVIQTNIDAFGAYAISGHGAYSKLEGLVFLPIMSMSMALPTFVSQNLGAGKYDRAKTGSMLGIAIGCVLAELTGLLFYFFAPSALHLFISAPEAIAFGTTHARTVSLFFFLLAFSHCSSGALRGCGKAFIPMIAMLTCWCGIRIIYVTTAIQVWPIYATIAWAYPLTWSLSSVIFIVSLLRQDWSRLDGKRAER